MNLAEGQDDLSRNRISLTRLRQKNGASRFNCWNLARCLSCYGFLRRIADDLASNRQSCIAS